MREWKKERRERTEIENVEEKKERRDKMEKRENGEMRERHTHRKTDKHPRNEEINMEEGRETLKF